MKKTIITCVLAFFCAVSFGISQNLVKKFPIKYSSSVTCGEPSGTDFSVNYYQRSAKAGVKDTVSIKVRAPKTSNEIPAFNKGKGNSNNLEVNCFPFLNGAKIKTISLSEVVLVEGDAAAFQGISVYTNAKNLQAGPGQKICVLIKGIITKPGIYKFDVKTSSKVSFKGLPAFSKCTVTNGYIKVVK